jgi:hypothetical protein
MSGKHHVEIFNDVAEARVDRLVYGPDPDIPIDVGRPEVEGRQVEVPGIVPLVTGGEGRGADEDHGHECCRQYETFLSHLFPLFDFTIGTPCRALRLSF